MATTASPKSKLIGMCALLTLVLQITSVVILLRYTRTMDGPRYISSTAIASAEVLKLLACLLVVAVNAGSPSAFLRELHREMVTNKHEIARVAVPSFLYVIQNNLLFFALSNLDAVVYQLLYQLKTLTTAMFSVAMLGKALSRLQWASLVVLMVGVTIVHTSTSSSKHASAESPALGLLAVVCASVTSGFSGVYFEKILKGSETTIWIRNIQLCVSSIPISFITVYTSDYTAATGNGFFYGYTPVLWLVIGLQAFGGLVVAVVVKYADNILKAFAASYSVITSLLAEMVLFDFRPNAGFLFGAVIVNLASYLYSRPTLTVASVHSGVAVIPVTQKAYETVHMEEIGCDDEEKRLLTVS